MSDQLDDLRREGAESVGTELLETFWLLPAGNSHADAPELPGDWRELRELSQRAGL